MKVRPAGVSIVAAAFIILGVYYLLWSILLLMSGAYLKTYDMVFYDAVGGNTIVSAILGIVTTIVVIAAGIGLLGMKPWAWYVSFIGAALMLVHLLFGLNEGNLLWGILQLVIVAAVAVYLLTAEVRASFGIGTTPS